MLDFLRRSFVRQKPIIKVYRKLNDFWTYVEFQLPQNSKVLVKPYNHAEYKFFDAGKTRHHVVVSGSSDVGFNTLSKEWFDRLHITEPTSMMIEMERLFMQARQLNTCSILGCGKPASIDIVCVRWEIGCDAITSSGGTPYRVCNLPEHLAETKTKHPRALKYIVSPHYIQASQ